MTHRVHNFGAGPAALPLPVLEQVQQSLLDFEGSGMSILEMSHRSATYDRVHQQTMADVLELAGAGDDYNVLFMGGGARTQFMLVPMNLRPGGRAADYLTTGRWSEMALAEAKKNGSAHELWSSADTGHDRVPGPGDFSVHSEAAYLHYTSNNTIAGTQYQETPEAGEVPLVCDMSSDIFSRPIDLAPFGVIYAGAQKNLGPAGVTIVIVRKDLLERCGPNLGDTMSYAKMAAKDSLLNTPPVFAIYMVGLVLQWIKDQGGLAAMQKINEEKAQLLYNAIDHSDGFYQGHAQEGSRSRMNVTFRLANPDLEATFVEEAAQRNLLGLKGHRSVGGIRASIYNATGLDAVRELVEFMGRFREGRG
ncbi:MAG: 3-phosphoserine/phosphohydroxythreonine transaminase [Acidobacteriota bacterium]|nr:3-phosphoserine/phosphohydroxythreonine transaminase [Acidobacteriota bacterium]